MKYRLKETQFLDLYRKGAFFIQRYERRKAAGDCTEMHERLLPAYKADMAAVQAAIDALDNEEYRRVLYDRFVLLMHPVDIANEVGDSLDNTKRKLYRAVHKIKVPEGVLDNEKFKR